MKKIKKINIQFGGHFSNFVVRKKHSFTNIKSVPIEEIEKTQKNVFLWCDMVSEYLEDMFLNNENFQILDIDLKRFIEDNDYYYHIYDNKRDIYNTICGWFENQIFKYFNQINQMVFYRKTSEEKIGGLIDIFTYLSNKHRVPKDCDVMKWYENHYSEISIGKTMKNKEVFGWGEQIDTTKNVEVV